MKYNQYFAIEKKMKATGMKIDRADLIYEFTNHRKTSLTELTPFEYKEFLKSLKSELKDNRENSPENKMRRKIISLFVHKMGYSMDGLETWCINSGSFKKGLNHHNAHELPILVTQAEKVHEWWMKNSRA